MADDIVKFTVKLPHDEVKIIRPIPRVQKNGITIDLIDTYPESKIQVSVKTKHATQDGIKQAYNIIPVAVWLVKPVPHLIENSKERFYSPNYLMDNKKPTIENEDFKQLHKVLKFCFLPDGLDILKFKEPAFPNRRHTALTFARYALLTDSRSQRMIPFFIALEHLFVFEDGSPKKSGGHVTKNDSKKDKIGRRLSAYLGYDNREGITKQREIRDLYNTRNNIVHGGFPIKLQKENWGKETTEQIVKKALKRVEADSESLAKIVRELFSNMVENSEKTKRSKEVFDQEYPTYGEGEPDYKKWLEQWKTELFKLDDEWEKRNNSTVTQG